MSPTVRDRTQEFLATVTSFQEHGKARKSPQNSTVTTLPRSALDQSQRMRVLSIQIATSISESEQRIRSLELLAAKTSNFRDERPKIAQLSAMIQKDINELNNNLKAMSAFLAQSFSPLGQQHDTVAHHSALVDVLSARYSQLAKSFASACDVTNKHLKRQKVQRDKFGLGKHKRQRRTRDKPLNRLKNRGGSTGRLHPSAQRHPPRIRQRRRNASESENEHLLAEQNQHGHGGQGMQDQTQMVLHADNVYSQQRAEEAEQIEGQLTEISQMMTKLAQIVDEQRHTILQIGDNVDDSIENMDGAIQQLQKYLSSLTGNRWLMIKVFALLIFLAVIFTVFVA